MRRTLTVIAVLVATAPALLAHPGHGTSAAAGALHPLSGLDHLLAMVAVGILAVRTGGRALWQVPAAFVACMIAGMGLGLAGCSLPGVEVAIAVSVLALGAMIAAAKPQPVWLACALVGVCALPHGCAHAHEMGAASPLPFLLGMVATTALLHAAGVGFGVLFSGSQSQRPIRWSGALISACGLALMANLL